MRRSCSPLALAIILAPPAAGQSPGPPERVVLTGQSTPAGGTYSFFYEPVLSSSGTVAFRADLSGAGGQATTGLFAGTAGAIQGVAVRGSSSPAGGVYANAPQPIDYVLTGDRVAFRMGSTNAFGASAPGVFSGPVGGPMQVVAVEGGAAPGGGTYRNMATSGDVAVNAAGQVAFAADLSAGFTEGVFAGTPGSVQALAVRGTPAPAGTAGTFYAFNSPRVNAAGRVSFAATLQQGSSFVGGKFLTAADGTVRTVATVGTPVADGGTVSNMANTNVAQPLAVNDAGRVAFTAFVTRGGQAEPAVLTGTPGDLREAARSGTAAPGGGVFNLFGNAPRLSAAGHVSFTAGVRQADGTGAEYTGLFVGPEGNLGLVARTGSAVPGGRLFAVGEHALNARGQVAFVGTLFSENGVTTATNEALYAGLPDLLLKVVQKGDVIDADPGAGTDLRTVSGIRFGSGTASPLGSGGEDGLAASFAADGRIVYALTFTNGTQGVFTSVVPVPEPAGLLVVLAGGLLVLRRRTVPGIAAPGECPCSSSKTP